MKKLFNCCLGLAATWVLTLSVVAHAAESVTFPSATLTGSDTNPQTVKGMLNKPAKDGPFAAVILLPHCGGTLSSNVSTDWPNYLTGLGYAVLTVNTFQPQGYATCEGLKDKNLSRSSQARYAYGALDYLAARDDIQPKRIAVVGFSEGAFAINDFIAPGSAKRGRPHEFAGAVSMYGGCRRLYKHTPEDTPLLLIEPEHDSKLAPLCISHAANSSHIYLQVLDDAYHAFDTRNHTQIKFDNAGNAMLYSLKATNEARTHTKAFLDATIGTNRGKKLERNVILGAGAARAYLASWIEANKDTLCNGSADAFADKVNDRIEDLKDEKKIVPELAISPFKMKRLRKDACASA